MKELLLLLFFLLYVQSCPELCSVFQWGIDKVLPHPIELRDGRPWGIELANNRIGGMKIWGNHMYIYRPRQSKGSTTLSRAPIDESQRFPIFKPFPNETMQMEGNDKFNSIQGMEIDPEGRMWLLDNPKMQNVTSPPSIIVLDLNNHGSIILHHKFDVDVLSRKESNMIDIVLDYECGGFAYIYNHHKNDRSLVVYSLNTTKNWKFNFSCLSNWTRNVPQTVLALSPAKDKNKFLYFSPPQKNVLYKIPVRLLRNNSQNRARICKKPSDHDGLHGDVAEMTGKLVRSSMTMLADGRIVFGVVGNTVGFVWNTTLNFTEENKFGAQSLNHEEQLNTFGFDEKGGLWYLHEINNDNNWGYVVIKSQLKYPNDYQYLMNGKVPKSPNITNTNDKRYHNFYVEVSCNDPFFQNTKIPLH